MKLRQIPKVLLGHVRRRPIVTLAIGVLLLACVAFAFKRSGSAAPASSFYEVKRSDFLISIVEGGTIEAVDEVMIRSEFEGVARIIYIVPEGSYVKEGDLLVELDSSQAQDTVNLQQITVEKAQFAVVQSEQQLDIQKSLADSQLDAADLKLEFAASDLKKYLEGEAVQLERNAQIEITNVLESLAIAQDRLEWSEKLYEQGFETKSNLDKDRLTVSQTKLKLEQAQKALWMLREFDAKKRKRELEAAFQEAKENRERVKLQGERLVAQYEADLTSQRSTLELSKKKLERDMKQLAATKIFAPQDGLVVYASGNRFSSESMIEEGAIVRYRQELIKLPDTSQMKLQVKIHESHINQIRVGQQAFVVLDSMPDQRFRGEVNKIGLLPDGTTRWSNPNLKVYATEVVITDQLPDIKPGVSARAEVVITNLDDVLTVPIQAVTTRKGQQVVFLATAPQQPLPVSVGMYNTKFIEVTSGLKSGDQVLLAPSFDTEERDLGGSVLTDSEAAPATTNKSARALTRNKAAKAKPSGQWSLTKERTQPNAGAITPAPRLARDAQPSTVEASSFSRSNREPSKQLNSNGGTQSEATERGSPRDSSGRERGRSSRPEQR
jgi:HlyD family secretion protein